MNLRIRILLILCLSCLHQILAQELPSYDNKFKFVENLGQWPEYVLFRAESQQGKMYIEQGRVLYQFVDASGLHKAHYGHETHDTPELRQELIVANFVRANKVTAIERKHKTREYYNFFIGQDKNKWASRAYGYADVLLKNLYDGIDLRFNNEGEHLKHEFIVSKGANPRQIKINYDNAKRVTITKKGTLRVEGILGVIEEGKPYVYQVKNGKIIEIKSQFKLEDKTVYYELGNYDNDLELIIDPAMIFASYSGSVSDNFGMTATYDNDGNLYSGGIVFGNSYPTVAGSYDVQGAFTQENQTAASALRYGVTDVFISKYSSDGTTMLYSTYLGGGDDLGGTEVVHSIICNEANELYFYGTTSSDDFPLVNPYQAAFNGGIYRQFTSNGTHFFGSDGTTDSGGTDLIIGKFSADGSNLLASTYLGGSANDGLNYNENGGVNGNVYGGLMYNYGDPFRGEIMLDDEGNCYIASCTYSTDFPLMNEAQSTYGGELDGVLIKFDSDLTNLLWSTYWGGSGRDACYAVKFDSEGNIYAIGGTRSANFPTTAGVIQETHNNVAEADGFVTRFLPDGSVATHSTLIGTNAYDQTYFLQIDRDDNVFILGQTRGVISPTLGTYSNPNSSQFIMRITNELNAIDFQTVFGNGNGMVNISPTAFLVDVCGNIYVSGWGGGIAGSLHQLTPITGMPTTEDAFQTDSGDGYNFYLIVLSRDAEDLVYASYLGGGVSKEHVDGGTSRFDEMGVVYHSACGGCGNPNPELVGVSDFPTFPSDVWSLTNESENCNNLVFKFDLEIVPRSQFTVSEIEGCAPFVVEFQNFSSDTTNYQWIFSDETISSEDFSPVVTFTTPGEYDVYLLLTDTICMLTDTSHISIIVHDELLLEIPQDTVVCAAFDFELVANSFGTSNIFLWSSQADFSDTLNNYPSDSSIVVSASETTVYYAKVTNEWCERIDSIQVSFILEGLEYTYQDTICYGDSLVITAINVNPDVIFTYQWSPDSIIVSGGNTHEVTVQLTVSQYVYLNAIGNNDCFLVDSFYVTVSTIDPSLVTAFSVPDSIPVSGSAVITGVSPTGYEGHWSSMNVPNPFSAQNTVTLTETTTFMYSVNNGYCSLEVPLVVKVFEFLCKEPYVFVPNAFTPDKSGFNDFLYVRGPYVYEMVFRVFNRWGEKVFETIDQSIGWDGTYNGRPCDPDVYDYYLDIQCIGGMQNIIKGNVTLIR